MSTETLPITNPETQTGDPEAVEQNKNKNIGEIALIFSKFGVMDDSVVDASPIGVGYNRHTKRR